MNKNPIQALDDLTLCLNFDLAILYSAIQDANEELEVHMLENFIKKIYEHSKEIRNIFDNEVI